MKKAGIKNKRAFERRLEKRIENAEDHVFKLIQDSTNLVLNTASNSIRSGGSGRTYQKYNPRRQHTASAEGQPPASDLGVLVNSLSTKVKRRGDKVIGQIIASAPYAPFLEFGTSNMRPRPFMQPALERNRARIRKKFKDKGYLK